MKFDYVLKTISKEKTSNHPILIRHFQVKIIISLCLITISVKICSVFNSSVLSNFISDLPILIPQYFFPHTICTLMVVDVITSYGTQKKDQIENRFKTMNELTQLIVQPLLLKISILYIESCFAHVLLVGSQAALEENFVSLLKALLFVFFVNCSFKRTFSL